MFRRTDLTPANRPVLQPDEDLLQVQESVGLYSGKQKIPNYQNGAIYLTSHRLLYISNTSASTHNIALDLSSIRRTEYYAGFLKSSPKITLHLTAPSSSTSDASPRNSVSETTSPAASSAGTSRIGTPVIKRQLTNWICPICSLSNPVPEGFSGAARKEDIPPCLACGIRPDISVLEKAIVESGVSQLSLDSRQGSPHPLRSSSFAPPPDAPTAGSDGGKDKGKGKEFVVCPLCTFHNHPEVPTCEMCNTALPTSSTATAATTKSTPSPPPVPEEFSKPIDILKLSFRSGGSQEFLTKLKEALVQRKWILRSAPAAPKPNEITKADKDRAEEARKPVIGIAGLERRGEDVRKKNEDVMGGAFEDLEALKARAADMMQVATAFAAQFPDESLPFHLPTIPTSHAPPPSGSTSTAFHHTIARQIADFLLSPIPSRRTYTTTSSSNDTFLASQGGTITLPDLYAAFNRSRGIDLISPSDLAAATALFETLSLPVRIKKFKRSGAIVVRSVLEDDEKTERRILGFVTRVRKAEAGDRNWGWGRGVTAVEVARQFGWYLGVAAEWLEMCEDRGSLCREVGGEGVLWWENWFGRDVKEVPGWSGQVVEVA
ncbi:hypothetical protein BJ508DRAFT_416000 [Ascobolus immersus RN42]|uniref:Vacuolar protein-sorting-associated protein 36 n=1 Tax=Ascobolus immersus RN42 TaxID=1160509 RepID=A0A3N4HZC0_ASCIM|nr:hypothetical protein BJ508DRAFT_416000 [Ascobolus immersus RN42]